MPDITIQPLNIADRTRLTQFMLKHWNSNKIISRGVIYYPQDLPDFVAMYHWESATMNQKIP